MFLDSGVMFDARLYKEVICRSHFRGSTISPDLFNIIATPIYDFVSQISIYSWL